jgi:ketosteroid isomerase-like protein
MSQRNVQAVRVPLAPKTRQQRTFDERIIVSFPRLARRWFAMWARLPRRSRLRKAILVRGVLLQYAAVNRRDFDYVRIGLDPGVELHRPQTFLDVSGTFRGHDGYLELWRRGFESFEDLRVDPEELLDFGDRFLVTCSWTGHGTGSGVPISQRLFQLVTLRRGLVIRVDEFQNREEALEAAGLSE